MIDLFCIDCMFVCISIHQAKLSLYNQELAALMTSLMQCLDSLLKRNTRQSIHEERIAGTVESQDTCVKIVHGNALIKMLTVIGQ